MRIDSVNNNMNMGMQTRMAQGMDAATKSIQNQIQAKQQELQKLSENEDMSPEDRMKKRQQIQQEISDLNMQLRQRQIDQRRQQQQSKGSSMDDILGGKQQAQKKSQSGQSAGLSQASMKAMISADSSMKQAAVQGSVAIQMQDRANVLKAEIKQSGSTEAKEAELADLEQKAMNATASQMNTLSDANATIEEAREAEKESAKSESSKTENTGKAKEKQEGISDNTENGMGVQTTKTQTAEAFKNTEDVPTPKMEEAVNENTSTPVGNIHVDVRL